MRTATILEDRGVLAVGGPEARDFLQNLISNDMGAVSPETAIYAALLTPQGKYLFDFLIAEHEDRFLLDTDRARLPDLLRRLMMYRLRADVTLEDESDGWTVAALLDLPENLMPTPGSCSTLDGAVLFTDPREPGLGARALLPAGTTLDDLGYAQTEARAYEARRIALGVPEGGTDLIVEKTLLLEGDFERLNGVSFDKGCYIGQELTARTKHRGNIRRRLYPVRLDHAVDSGTEITLEGRPVGEVRSVAGDRAIAFLRIDDVNRAEDEGLLMVASDVALRIEKGAP